MKVGAADSSSRLVVSFSNTSLPSRANPLVSMFDVSETPSAGSAGVLACLASLGSTLMREGRRGRLAPSTRRLITAKIETKGLAREGKLVLLKETAKREEESAAPSFTPSAAYC